MGTGVTDFFVKPFQGVKDGSIVQAADGLYMGSKSLIKNTFMAPVGALSKFGNSISKGTLALSFDDKFIEEKNYDNKKNKPKNVGDGLVKGFSSAGTSILSGVTGVFTKPVEGAKQEGVGGFFKGIGKGAAGLVTKTVSGTIDIVAKTTEGLDNQAKSSGLPTSGRIRNPRPFYEVHYLIRPYNQMHADWQHAVPQLAKSMDLSTIYDIFAIAETPRMASADDKGKGSLKRKMTLGKNKKEKNSIASSVFVQKGLKKCVSTIYILTKYFIAELVHTVVADVNDYSELNRPNPSRKM